jgi:hypothetical protein
MRQSIKLDCKHAERGEVGWFYLAIDRAEFTVKAGNMSTTGECQPLKDDSSEWSMLVFVSYILSVSIFLNSRLHYRIPVFRVEELTNRNIRIKPTRAYENI